MGAFQFAFQLIANVENFTSDTWVINMQLAERAKILKSFFVLSLHHKEARTLRNGPRCKEDDSNIQKLVSLWDYVRALMEFSYLPGEHDVNRLRNYPLRTGRIRDVLRTTPIRKIGDHDTEVHSTSKYIRQHAANCLRSNLS